MAKLTDGQLKQMGEEVAKDVQALLDLYEAMQTVYNRRPGIFNLIGLKGENILKLHNYMTKEGY